jgi:hypothetical protein
MSFLILLEKINNSGFDAMRGWLMMSLCGITAVRWLYSSTVVSNTELAMKRWKVYEV